MKKLNIACNVNVIEAYCITQKEYFKLLGKNSYYRIDNEVYFKSSHFPNRKLIKKLTDKQLKYAICLENHMESYFINI